MFRYTSYNAVYLLFMRIIRLTQTFVALGVVTTKIIQYRRLVQFSIIIKTFATKYKLTINFCSIYSLNPSLAATYLSYPRDQVKVTTNIQIGIQMGNITVDAGVIRCTPLHKL